MAKRRSDKNPRLGCFAVLMSIFSLVLAVRLLSVHIFQRDKLVADAASQHARIVTLEPERGKIYDRHGSLLAFNVPAVSVVTNVDSIRDRHAVAARLSPIIGLSYESIIKKLRKGSGWVELAKKQPVNIRDRINQLNLDFVGCRDDLVRRYPKSKTAAQVVGFTRSDGAGGNGLELAWNEKLSGKPGTAIMQRTGRARLFSHPHYPIRLPDHGDDLVLTIDFRYQRIAEQELQRTIEEYNAIGGSVVMMEPSSGDILAIFSSPSYDPNHYGDYSKGTWRLAAITDQFEPGSTFKPAMLAAMLDAGYKKETDIVHCENGTWNIMGETIRDTKKYGDLTVRDVLVLSSNIGMAKMAMDFDNRIMHQYALDFGFGSKSGIELLGEISGMLKHPKEWVPFSQLTFSYGHEIAVTALQMCAMYATIANDGYYVSPRIVKEIYHKGKPVYYDPAAERRSVIAKETSLLMRDIMEEVVTRGTGLNAAVDSLRICGKTGTAHVVRADGGGYAANRYISSFGGFFPKNEPKIVIYIMINEPKGGYFGGAVAAPCFQRISKRLVELEGLNYFQERQPSGVFVDNGSFGLPNLVGLSKASAIRTMRLHGLEYRVYGGGELIVAQEPAPGDSIPENEFVYLTTDFNYALQDSIVSVPDVVHLPVRNAINLLRQRDFSIEIQGHGTVVRQHPRAGEQVVAGERIQIFCKAPI
ncbi:PASTA domain-containing protein [candidate division KSB1 bacterium]|nr:PASTA domain-containing protein [candidate division KSB1 bacterium]RQW04365.1 MAG: PASTA domain-containing protein [candidate division KSB1 bacterium]